MTRIYIIIVEIWNEKVVKYMRIYVSSIISNYRISLGSLFAQVVDKYLKFCQYLYYDNINVVLQMDLSPLTNCLVTCRVVTPLSIGLLIPYLSPRTYYREMAGMILVTSWCVTETIATITTSFCQKTLTIV